MTEVYVESKKNATLALVRSLQEKKYRRIHDLFFVEGVTLFEEATAAGLVARTVVLSTEVSEELLAKVRARLQETECRLLLVPHSVYESVSAEQAPQGVLAVFSVSELLSLTGKIHSFVTQKSARYLILEQLQDPGNVGAILRSAAAFGYRGAVLVNSADLFNPKTLRACMGALFRLELFVVSTTQEALALAREKGLTLYATSPHAKKDVAEADYSRPFALLIGNEGGGLSREALEACDEVLTIPMQGMESLNAACAAAVVLYESARGEK